MTADQCGCDESVALKAEVARIKMEISKADAKGYRRALTPEQESFARAWAETAWIYRDRRAKREKKAKPRGER